MQTKICTTCEQEKDHLSQTRTRQRKYYHNNPDIYKNQKLKIAYGITLEQYNNLLNEQNGVCAICGLPETSFDKRTKKVRLLSVDHNHQLQKVRGLLCNNCNNGLGRFLDDEQNLLKAIKYLKKYTM